MSTKTGLVKEKLAKNPNPNTEQVKAWAKEIKCSPALIYKWLRKIPEEQRRVVQAGEPITQIEEEPEIVIEEPAEEGEFEPPSLEEELPKEEVEKPTEVLPPAPAELEAEEERKLNDIIKRSIMRFFNVGLEEGLGLGKELGIGDQEATDTQYLAMAIMAKYFRVEIKQNLLEIASGLHFGSLGLKVLVAWVKKRKAKKKEEEKPETPTPTPTPAPATETLTPAEEEAKEDREARAKEKQTETENKLKRKWEGI